MDFSEEDLSISQPEDVETVGIDSLTIEDDLDNQSLNNSETEEMTATEVLELIERMWHNEKFSPEILPNRSDVVECLLVQITSMEENLENTERTEIQKSLYRMELDRLRYLITSYLRFRLEKIELYTMTILNEEQNRINRGEQPYLTEGELQFAKEHQNNLETHFNNVLSFWNGLPLNDWKNTPVTPNNNSFIFLRSRGNVDGVVLDDEQEEDIVDFKTGSQLIISYNSVSNLVKNDQVQLI